MLFKINLYSIFDGGHKLSENNCITLQYFHCKFAGTILKYHSGHVGIKSGAQGGTITPPNDQGLHRSYFPHLQWQEHDSLMTF